MSGDYRHHAATRREIIFVPVPYEAGTVKNTRFVHPPAYRHNQHQPWKPRTTPPNRKVEAIRRFLEDVHRQEEALKEFMKPDASLLKAWLSGGAVR